MKKFLTFFLLISIVSCYTTACSAKKPKQNLIQSKRRFAEYVEPQKPANVIDLSEGPKLRYDAKLGPRSLNFDIKIVDPY